MTKKSARTQRKVRFDYDASNRIEQEATSDQSSYDQYISDESSDHPYRFDEAVNINI